MEYSKAAMKILIRIQKDEINAYHIYTALSKSIKDVHNKKLLARIAHEEFNHYKIFKGYTNLNISKSRFYIFIFTLLAKGFGLTFGLKLMEKQESSLGQYRLLIREIPEIERIIEEEEEHEGELLNMISEEKLTYMGSVVLGLNDALVELTGALAGFTLSLQNSRMIALMGLITGISASLSMAASEYLSSKAENDEQINPKKAAIYTGIAYVLTVAVLILPFLLIQNYIISLAITLLVAILVIAFFNYYISIAKDQPFFKRFLEMTLISLGVAVVSFGIGYLVNRLFGLDA